ncbi:DUF928 domain-containing protein [Okeanomitos corallinicola TIOX110]|uniref:DUF928 domain-containing protein n=1 Tax=Okeanomitos corallinicola TIOX110 TaxID=3133117 RepID=A0ABZ2UW61_9CYAN
MTKKTAFTIKILAVRFLTAIFIISSLSTQSQAQLNPGYKVSVKFPQVADRGAPKRTEGSGARGGCDLGENQSQLVKLKAIAPNNNIITSLNPHPAIYVYSQIVNKPVDFQIFELNPEKDIYTTQFSLPQNPGIVKVKLPETLKLQANKIYGWRFIVRCEPAQRDADKFVEGWLEIKSLTAQQLERLENFPENPKLQAQLYSDYGIWHETLEILANWQENHLLKSEWNELLESVELKEFANYSVNSCCQVADSPTTPVNTNDTEIPKTDATKNNSWGGNL